MYKSIIAGFLLGFATFSAFSQNEDSIAGYDPAVKQAQEYLDNAGYSPGPIDGFLGEKTINAIKDYQRDQGLSETGKLDQPTRSKMGIGSPEASVRDAGDINPSQMEGHFFKWDKLTDITGVRERTLANKIELVVHDGEPTRYAAVDASGEGMTVADGTFGNRTYSGMTSQTWVGSRKGEHLDEGFYALLGVGTEIELPNYWVSIFGIRCKGGKISILKGGVNLSNETMIDQQ